MVDDLIYEIDDVDVKELKSLESGQLVNIPKGVTLGTKTAKAKMNGAKIKPSKEGKKSKKKTTNLFDGNLEGTTDEQQYNLFQYCSQLMYSPAIGNKSVVVVRVQTTDAVYSNSEAFLRSKVFGIGEGGDQFNLAVGYDQCSFGQLTFSPLASQSGSGGVSIENGVVTISVDVSVGGNNSCSLREVIANDVTTKIKAAFGIDKMQDLADYWMCECALIHPC